MGKLVDYVVKLGALGAGLLLIFLTVSTSYTIFARAVDLPSPVWTVQFNEYALLWITFLGTAWVLGRKGHVSVDLLVSRLNPSTKTMFDVAHSVVGCVLCAVIFWFGLLTVRSTFVRGVMDVGSVDVPKYLILMVIPLGFFLLAVQFARRALVGLRLGEAPDSIHGNAGDRSTGNPE